MAAFLLFFLCCISMASLSEQTDEVCLPVRRDSTTVTVPPPEIAQGRPGKVGPMGLTGQKGERGITGQCTCDVHEKVNDLREELDDLKGQVGELRSYAHEHVDKVADCSVGIGSGLVRDEDLTASSEHSSPYRARFGRLNNKPDGANGNEGVWHYSSLEASVGQWIQVDLKRPVRVTGVITQGRSDVDQWPRSYKILFGNSTDSLQAITDPSGSDMIFPGNHDRNSYKINYFPQPVLARYFRLVVHSGNAILRMDYLTC